MPTDTPSHDLRSALEPQLVERVARALCKEAAYPWSTEKTDAQNEADIEERWPGFQVQARVALTAALASDTIGNGGGENSEVLAVVNFAKSRAWHHFGIAWEHLEKVSQDELVEQAAAFMIAPSAHPPAAEPVAELGWNPTHEVEDKVYPYDAEPVGLREAKASFEAALSDLSKRDSVRWEATEDSQHIERIKACKARCKRWGACDERDGSCSECDSDMAEALETAGSMKRRLRNYEARVDRFFQSDGLRAITKALATPARTDDAAQAVKRIEDGHADTEGEANALFEHLNCPACGGSGHIDDVAAQAGGDAAAMREALIKHMANRFLGWKLPEDFWPDGGISFISVYPNIHEPIGTNLFTAIQAEAMVRYMLEGAALPSQEVEPAAEAARDAQVKTVAEKLAAFTGAPYEDWRHFTVEAGDILDRLAALSTQAAYPTGAGEGLPADVVALVVAGREAWEAMLSSDADPEACAALDKALERFASRVCYDDEGGTLPDAHADPCTCGTALTPADARKGEG